MIIFKNVILQKRISMQYVNPIYTSPEKIEELLSEFKNAKPYPHLVLDEFLKPEIAQQLYDNFPSIEKLKKHYNGLNENKAEGANFQDFPDIFRQMRTEIMSEALSTWMAQVTGIENLFVTDDKLGTGLHQGGDGSFLDIHIDFNIHAEKNVHRRLNMLIYLNPNWQDDFGGDLEMWNADMSNCDKKVTPDFNRAVVFETNEISYHGYGKMTLPEGVTRKSIYTYFYTELREDAVGYHDTVFKPRPDDSTAKKIGTNVKEGLKNFTKAQLKKVGINL